MATDDNPVFKSLLSNRHLKEWNDHIAAEVRDLYILRCKHKVERDYLVFEQNTEVNEWASVVKGQQQELANLKQHHSAIRIKLQERHYQERARSRRLVLSDR